MKNSKLIRKTAVILAATSIFAAGCGSVQAPEDTERDSQTSVSTETIENEEVAKADSAEPVTVRIGTTSDENRIWDALNAELKDRGENITVEWINVQQTNQVLADGEVDLNAFQHYAYFEQNTADLGLDLTAIGETLIVPLNLFSEKVSSVDEIPENGKIAIPEDATNQGRALHVLENAGIIKLADSVGVNGKVSDIVDNPKNIEIVEMEGPELPRTLADVDAAIINCGYATDYGLDPVNDPIYKDEIDFNDPAQHPFINIIAARTEDKDNETYLKVVDAYHSERVAKAILEVYNNAAIPAFDY